MKKYPTKNSAGQWAMPAMDYADIRTLYRLLQKYDEAIIIDALHHAQLEGRGDQWLDVNIYHFVSARRAELEGKGKARGALTSALAEATKEFLSKKDQNAKGIERLKKAYQRGKKHHERFNAWMHHFQPGKK